MTRFVRTGVLLSASALLLTGLSVGTAEAKTGKELKICYKNDTPSPGIGMVAVADGPSYRRTQLADGECKAWSVRPGGYQLRVGDAEDWSEALYDACNSIGQDTDFKARLKRQGSSERLVGVYALLLGVDTNIRKNRSTSYAIHVRCVP